VHSLRLQRGRAATPHAASAADAPTPALASLAPRLTRVVAVRLPLRQSLPPPVLVLAPHLFCPPAPLSNVGC
jgi:hypothetical protein